YNAWHLAPKSRSAAVSCGSGASADMVKWFSQRGVESEMPVNDRNDAARAKCWRGHLDLSHRNLDTVTTAIAAGRRCHLHTLSHSALTALLNVSGSAGLVRWPLKPASSDPRRTCSSVKPVKALIRQPGQAARISAAKSKPFLPGKPMSITITS